MSEIPILYRDESFHIVSEEQLAQLFLPRSAWISDNNTTRCYNCNKIFFLFFRRKHHCRKCGNIFCSKCSNYFFDASALKLEIFEEKIRLCNSCYSKFADFKKFLTKEVHLNIKNQITSPLTFENIPEESKLQDQVEVDYINNSKANVFHKNLDLKLEYLVSELLKENGIFEKYYDILMNFIKVALNEVRPNSVFWGDNMDINQYIKIKRLSYHDNSETKYIRGVVFKKNLLDRKMPWSIENARILLLSSSIDVDFLQPNSHFSSFDNFITHEKGFFKTVAKNILRLQPNVILLEKTIHRNVAEWLKKHNIMIFVKVKRNLISKIARLTRCRIVNDFTKLGDLNPEEYIGKCSNVYVKKMGVFEPKLNEHDSDSTQDILYIEGCNPLYGVTITISGPNLTELKTLKSSLKTILKIGRNWLLEHSLIDIDQKFGLEIKDSYFVQGNLAKQLGQESFSYEKIVQDETVFYTKVNFIQGDVKKIPDFEKKPYLLKDLEISLDQEGEESILRCSKLCYFAEICGYPSLKKIDFYSQDDISLGCYIILRGNSFLSPCISCNKYRHVHDSFYYNDTSYIKISSEYLSTKGNNNLEKHYHKTIDLQINQTMPKRRKISDLSNYSPYKNSPKGGMSPITSTQNLSQNIETLSHSDRTMDLYFKPKFSLFCMNQLKSSENLNMNQINSEAVIQRSTTMQYQRESPSPNGTPKNVPLAKRNAVIKSYIQCISCDERLTEVRILDHEYLEYSLAMFLKRLFQTKIDDEEIKELFEQQGEDMNCMHAMKTRVFEYEETLMKFYVGSSKFYRISEKPEFSSFKDSTKNLERSLILKKQNEYLEIFEKTLEKLSILIECFKNDEDIIKGTMNTHLEFLYKATNDYHEKLSLFFSNEFELQEEIEEIRIIIVRDIIAIFDYFLIVIRSACEGAKKSQFFENYFKNISNKKSDFFNTHENKDPEEMVKEFLHAKKKNFFPDFAKEYAMASVSKVFDDKEEYDKNLILRDANLKYSCEPTEYLFDFEYELVLQKKTSDLVAKLFFEQQDGFRQKFKDDDPFQLKHLEIEFRDFVKLTNGQCIDCSVREEGDNLQFFKHVPFDKHHPLGIVAHALNSRDYLEEIYSLSGKYKSFNEILEIKKGKVLKPTPPPKFCLQACLVDNFLSTLTLMNDPKKSEIDSDFISQPNVSFPKKNKHFQFIEISIFLPIEFEMFRKNNSIVLKKFISSLAESAQIKGEKSSSILLKPVLTSHDEFFLFKSLKKKQFEKFLAFADHYFMYMIEQKEMKKHTALVKIFGAFQVTMQNKSFYYLCMENLLVGLENKPSQWKMYDLKGTSINRYMTKDRLNRTLLDNNYKIERNGEPLPLYFEDKKIFDQAIDNDIEFMRNQRLVDYSLLLIENKEKGLIRTGIINFFTEFEEPKKIPDPSSKKHFFEEKKTGKGNIAEKPKEILNDPILYAKQFKRAMRKYFMEIVDD